MTQIDQATTARLRAALSKVLPQLDALHAAIFDARKVNPLISVAVGGGRYNVCETHELPDGSSRIVTLADGLTEADAIAFLRGMA